MLITREVLTRMGATGPNADRYVEALDAAMARHAIDTAPRIVHFLAQTLHESGCLRLTEENLNYSADGLLRVFPRYFPTRADAEACARKPERIGNRVYCGRMGNGPEASGDGFRYRGRGLIQLTGKDNYRALARWCGQDVVAEPDRVGSELAVQSAVFFWERNALNDLADIDDLKAITRRINGGLNGFADRRELLEKGRHALRELGLAGSVAPASVPFAPTHRVVPLQLNLRSAPRVSPATLLASLAQGTEVEVRGPASAAGWLRVRVMLGGTMREGVVAEQYLAALAPQPRARGRARAAMPGGAALPALPPAVLHDEFSAASRARPEGRIHPLAEADRPARRARASAARAAELQAILDWLDVTNPVHRRYRPLDGRGVALAYVADCADLAGVYLPHVWWTDTALRRLTLGDAVDPVLGQTVHEIGINALHDWLDDHGPAFGWVRELDPTLLQAAANAGEVCVIVARHRDIDQAGQVSLVVPEQPGAEALRRADGEVLRPLESMAGRRGVRAAVSRNAWWTGRRFQSFAFWRHP
jgi:predicted chitinase